MRVRRNRLCLAALVAVAGALVTATPARSAPTDGGRIVVSDNDTGQLVTMDPDGTDVVPITPAGENAFHAKWSHDGSRVVFASSHAKSGVRIFMVNADGSGFHQVSSATRGYNDFTPAFDAADTRVLFSRCRPDGPHDGCSLMSTKLDGSDLRALVPRVLGDDFWPDVSPDGSRIAFNRNDYQGIQDQVWVVNVDGSNAHPITPPALEASVPRWTRDGHHLLVTSLWAHGGDNIYRIDEDGGHLTRLTNRKYPHDAYFASPSPSGAQISYADDQASADLQSTDVMVMNADGSGKHAITTGAHYNGPDWGRGSATAGASRSPYRMGAVGTGRAMPHLPRGLSR